MQDLEALCLNTKALGPRGSAQDEEAPGFGTTINKRMNIFKIMSLKLMLIMTTNPYINLQIGHLIQECIKVYNGIILLITSLGHKKGGNNSISSSKFLPILLVCFLLGTT